MIFEVTQSLAITMNGFQTTIKKRFDVEFLALNKAENKRVFGIEKKKSPSISINNNEFLDVIEELDLQTYPIEIETDLEGNFIKMLNHKKWLKNWELKTETIAEKFEDSQNVKYIRDQYLEIVSDEEKFIKYRFKEPFWNLLFFNPPIDAGNKPNIGTAINWTLISLGHVECEGRTELKNPSDEEVTIFFESKQKLTEDIIESLKSKTNIEEINWEEQKTSLQIGSVFNTIQKKLKNKKALFELVIEGVFSYVEETVINFKKIQE
jgi:hypothetical protein